MATTHAKVANSGKMVIARRLIRYRFQKRAALRYRSWKTSSLF